MPTPRVPFDRPQAIAVMARLPSWKLSSDARSIERTIEFADFPEAIAFVDRAAVAAEKADHHPDIDIRHRRVRLVLTTKDAGGLTEKDVALAEILDRSRS